MQHPSLRRLRRWWKLLIAQSQSGGGRWKSGFQFSPFKYHCDSWTCSYCFRPEAMLVCYLVMDVGGSNHHIIKLIILIFAVFWSVQPPISIIATREACVSMQLISAALRKEHPERVARSKDKSGWQQRMFLLCILLQIYIYFFCRIHVRSCYLKLDGLLDM